MIRRCRSFLYVPGDQSPRFPKAAGSGADCVVIDLEDAVVADKKAEARQAISTWLKTERPDVEVVVRINGVASRHFNYADLELAAECALGAIVVPKIETVADVVFLDHTLSYLEHSHGLPKGNISLILILETAKAIADCRALATASPRVIGVVAGGGRDGDTARSLGYNWTPEGDETIHFRARLLLDARAAGIAMPIYSGWMEVRDLEGLERDARRTRNLGYVAQMVIHPSHVPICNRVYAPSEAEIAHYRRVATCFRAAEARGLAAIEVDGGLVDLAMAVTAEEILRQFDEGARTMSDAHTTYRDIKLSFPDVKDWVLGKVLERRAAEMGDQPYLQWENNPALSFAETNKAVNRIAHGLTAAGVKHGDRVMILLPNCLEYVLTWFALAKLGALEVPVNSHYRGHFLEHVANNCAARIVVTDGEFLEHFAESEDRLPHLQTLFVRKAAGAVPAFSRLAVRAYDELRSDNDADPGIAVAYTDPVAILFTSGTTGPSKGVIMPHAQMYFFAEQGASLVRLEPSDVYMNAFPLFHGNAQFLTTYPCLIRGARAVLYERFSASEWIDRVRRNGVTLTNLLGVTMDFVFKQEPRPEDSDNKLRLIYAVPTANAILDQFKARFGVEVFVDAFGQTETCWPLMTPFDEPRPTGAVGKIVADWYDVRLVDPDTDEEVGIGELGELVVRPKKPWTLCAGYNGIPEATLRTMRNLWWHTGDGMRRDADGWFYFVDRVNDAMRVRGENVSSYEVEQVVLSHPDVLECAAIGLRSGTEGGEHEIKIYVVPKPGRSLDPADLIAYCDGRAPFFAVPRYVEFIDALPRTPSEKIQKNLLRANGITPATWDRLAAGVTLKHEQNRKRKG